MERVLRRGHMGEDVGQWQHFLMGEGLYKYHVDDDFGKRTEAATKKYQRRESLEETGMLDIQTLAAAIQDGFDPLEDNELGLVKNDPGWPEPMRAYSLSQSEKEKTFGVIKFRAAPTSNNPERVVISNNWQKNITMVEIPQLHGVKGTAGRKKFPFHKKLAGKVVELFQAWEDAGLIHLLKTYAGSWVPRYVRGSRTYLSSHAWGTAFDINAAWNMRGKQPALVGKRGSVRELVPIAMELGWWWGGHWKKRDGMHFEVYDVD